MNVWDRSQLELAFAMNPSVQSGELQPQDLVWTKLSYVLGQNRPTSKLMSAVVNLVAQKMIFDEMWDTPFGEMISTLDGGSIMAEGYEEMAKNLNDGNARHADEIRTFGDAFDAEAKSAAWRVREEGVLHEMIRIAQAAGLTVPAMTEVEKAQLVEMARRGAGLALALRSPVAIDKMRTLYVTALFHASIRWDRGTNVTANDLFDLEHAAAAVGYFDLFFTERKLHARLTRKEVAADLLYGCKVASSPQVALDLLLAL